MSAITELAVPPIATPSNWVRHSLLNMNHVLVSKNSIMSSKSACGIFVFFHDTYHLFQKGLKLISEYLKLEHLYTMM